VIREEVRETLVGSTPADLIVLPSAISTTVYRGDLVIQELQSIGKGTTCTTPPIDWVGDGEFLDEETFSETSSNSDTDTYLVTLDEDNLSEPHTTTPLELLDRTDSSWPLGHHPSTLVPPPVPVNNPIGRLIEQGTPTSNLRAELLRQFFPSQKSLADHYRRSQEIFAMVDSEEKDRLIAEIFPDPRDGPIAARFFHFPGNWQKIGAPPYIVDMIQNGMPLNWLSGRFTRPTVCNTSYAITAY
jgi:hypothetical protein